MKKDLKLIDYIYKLLTHSTIYTVKYLKQIHQITGGDIYENVGSIFYDFTYSFFEERNLTRGEAATIMSRYDGSEDTFLNYPHFVSKTFIDVPSGKWLTPAVEWAAENGIVDGVGGKYFAPDRNITREEFAAIMYRYTEYKGVECDASADLSAYPDSEHISSWADEAMRWAVGTGLIPGKTGNLLAPTDNITRAETAVIIFRYNNTVLAHRDNCDIMD